MAKHYIIPIGYDGQAYLGRKSMINPYSAVGAVYNWGRGAPNVFGGNDDGRSLEETLYLETREESRFKIDLAQNNLVAQMVELHNAVDNDHNTMDFYAIRGNFIYNPHVVLPHILLNQPRYRECTGQILRINLNTMNLTTDASANAHVLAAYIAEFGIPHVNVQMNDFYNSESMMALRIAANMVQWGNL